MKKIKISKRLLAFIVAGSITAGGTATFYKLTKKNPNKIENSVGYEDINPIFNLSLDDKDFVVLNVGSHDSIGVHFQNRKMKYCNEKDMSLGIVVSSDEHTEAGIYDDVEYTKGLISKYNIDFPVYFDINTIIEDDDLNLEMKEKLIKDFLEKCEANGIYVGIYGTDTNLCRTKKYCNVNDYDAFLVMDNKNIKYSGIYNIYKDLDGNVKSIKNLAPIINEKKLNVKSGFNSDGSYIYGKDDDITDIAMKYGMSVNELLEFNNIDKDDLNNGLVLRIPTIIGKAEYLGTGKYREVETPLRGCDLSYAQAKNSNWEELKDNFSFIILRATNGLSVDDTFEYNVSNCASNNIPIGVYCYNGFDKNNCTNISEFKKRQEEQADFILSKLKNKKISYPVYLDIEYESDKILSEKLPKKYISAMINIWKDKISSSSYIPGLYCNQTSYKYIEKCTDFKLSDEVELWLAGGDQYKNETISEDDIEFKYVVVSDILDKEYGASMVQSTNVAVNAGSRDTRGHLDIDFSKIDYTKEILKREKSSNNFKIKEFKRIDYLVFTELLLSGIAGIGVISYNIRKKRKKQRLKVKRR